MTLPEIIQKNEEVKDSSRIPWIVRETMVMRKIQEMESKKESVSV